MNVSLLRMVKSVYRKEPISSFVAMAGAVDIAIGGVSDRWSLLTFGLGTVGVAIAFRWWQIQQHRQMPESGQVAVRALPPRSSRNELPPLSMSKKRRSQ